MVSCVDLVLKGLPSIGVLHASIVDVNLIHLVFSTKNRQAWISTPVEEQLFPYLATELRNMECPSLAINGTEDHIHILFALSRTKTIADVVKEIADVVKEIKGSTSRWIKHHFPGLGSFQWQAGYGGFSIGRSQVITYIKNQKAHHRLLSFQDELRTLLKKYEVPFDERYVWD